MSREVTITAGLNIRKLDSDTESTQLLQRAYQAGYVADMAGAKGPTPGALTVATTGTQVSFSQLTRPKWCWFQHLGRVTGANEADDHVEIGIYDPATTKFYPLAEIEPGQSFVLPLSRNLQEIYVGPGSGTSAGGETARMMLLAYPVAQVVSVEAYEY